MKYFSIVISIILIAFSSCRTTKQSQTDGFSKAQTDTLRLMTSKVYLIEGTDFMLRGRSEEAVRSFQKSLAYNEENDAAWYNLSRIYASAGMAKEAILTAEKSVKYDPKNKWYVLNLAGIYQRFDRGKDAVVTFEKLLKLDPDDIDNYFLTSDAYIQINDTKKAVEVLGRAEKKFGQREEIIFQKYRIYAYQRDYTKAIAEIEKLIQADPSDVRNYGIIAELYEEQGQNEKALEYYNKILMMDPGNGIAHLSLARYYYSKKENDKAFDELKLAFASTDVDIDTKMSILLDYYEKQADGNKPDPNAYQLLEILIETHPESAKAYSIKADFLLLEGKKKEALDLFHKALEYDKSSYILWGQVIVLDSELDDADALYKDSKEAMTLFPSQALFYYFHGISAIRKELYQEAVDALETGKNLVFDDKNLQFEFYQLLGESYYHLKDYTQSDYNFEEALKIKPEHALILNNYSYYLALRNEKLDKAEEMSKKANSIAPNQASYQDTYGYILFRKKNYKEAEVWFKKALDNGGDQIGVIVEHYGDVLFMLGKTDEAVNYWKKAKELKKTSPLIDKKIDDRKYYEE